MRYEDSKATWLQKNESQRFSVASQQVLIRSAIAVLLTVKEEEEKNELRSIFKRKLSQKQIGSHFTLRYDN